MDSYELDDILIKRFDFVEEQLKLMNENLTKIIQILEKNNLLEKLNEKKSLSSFPQMRKL